MNRLPGELVRFVDDFCDVQTNVALKCTCKRFYDALMGKDLTHLHISPLRVRIAQSQIEAGSYRRRKGEPTSNNAEYERLLTNKNPADEMILYSGTCGCNFGRSLNWRDHSCQRRFFQLTQRDFNKGTIFSDGGLTGTSVISYPGDFVDDQWLEQFSSPLEYVTSISVQISHMWRADEVFLKVFDYCPNVELIELDYVRQDDLERVLEGLKMKNRWGLDSIGFRLVPSMNVALTPVFLEEFFEEFPVIRALKLFLVGNQTMRHYDELLMCMELEWLTLTVLSPSDESAEAFAPLLVNLPKLKYLTFPTQIKNPRNVVWLPRTVEELSFTPITTSDIDAASSYISQVRNGNSVKRLTIHGKLSSVISNCYFGNLEHLIFANWMYLTFLQDEEESTHYGNILYNINPQKIKSLFFDPVPVTDDVIYTIESTKNSLECLKITISDSSQGIREGLRKLIDGVTKRDAVYGQLKFIFLGTDILFSHPEVDAEFWKDVRRFFSNRRIFPALNRVQVGGNRLDIDPPSAFVEALPGQQVDNFAVPLPMSPVYCHYRVLLDR